MYTRQVSAVRWRLDHWDARGCRVLAHSDGFKVAVDLVVWVISTKEQPTRIQLAMTTIGRSNIPAQTTTTQAQATTPATSPPTNAPAQTVTSQAPLQPAVVSPKRPPRGFPAGLDASKIGTMGSSGATQGLTGEYVARPTVNNYSFAGYGNAAAVATVDGFQLDLEFYTTAKEEIFLFLQVPLMDANGALTYVTLDVLSSDGTKHSSDFNSAAAKEPLTDRPGFYGRATFAFSLADLNAHLKAKGLQVELRPGDQLSVGGLVDNSGHRIFNGASNSFGIPKPLGAGAMSSTAIRAGAQQTIKAADVPLDISLKLPPDIMQTQIKVGGKAITLSSVLEGEVTTRLESEYKGSVTAKQMDSMITNAYRLGALSERALAGDAKARAQLDKELGPDLVLEPVKRHWLASDGKPVGSRDPATLTVQRDANGWPLLDAMVDSYSDDKALTFSAASGAARVRGNAQKTGHAEFKFGGGLLDERTGIRQRVEVGLGLKPGASEADLKAIFQYITENPLSPLANSPLGQVIAEARKANVLDAMIGDRTTFAVVTQNRHKFELTNTKTGTKAELSLDMVHAKTVRPEHQINGVDQEETYYVIETELDHLQLTSANQVDLGKKRTSSALLNAASHDDFFKTAKTNNTDFTPLARPQLHSLDQVHEGSFRQTPSYTDFESMNAKLLAAVCGSDLPGPARQKAGHFAQLIKLVPPENTATTGRKTRSRLGL
jgi:hypothetical protein